MYPEGGFLGCSLENRVYFQALDHFNKSINVEGRVVDSSNQIVAKVLSGVDGRGKSELFLVSAEESYFFEITSPIPFVGQKTQLPRCDLCLTLIHRCEMLPVLQASYEENKVHVEIRSQTQIPFWLELYRQTRLLSSVFETGSQKSFDLDPAGCYGVCF